MHACSDTQAPNRIPTYVSTPTQGSCEPEHHAWAPGKPFYVPGKLGCEHHDEHEEEEHDHEEEGHDHRRLQLQQQRQQQHRVLSAAIGGLGGALLLGPEEDFVLAANMTKTRLQVDDAAQARFLEALGTPSGVFEVRACIHSYVCLVSRCMSDCHAT
jgi:hypothetical protein